MDPTPLRDKEQHIVVTVFGKSKILRLTKKCRCWKMHGFFSHFLEKLAVFGNEKSNNRSLNERYKRGFQRVQLNNSFTIKLLRSNLKSGGVGKGHNFEKTVF